MKPLKRTKKLWASMRTRKDVEFPAFLGNLNGTVKADERGNVFVTLFSGDVLTVYNARVPNKPRLPVVIGYEASNPKLLQVLRSRDVYANGASQPDLPDHNHTWGRSTNPTWVRGEQFLPGLVTPNSDVSVHYTGLVYWLDGAFYIVPEQDIDLSANIPASGAIFAILEVDDTGVISVLEGTPVDSAGLLTYADIPEPSADKKPLMFAVKLYAGQTVIKQGFSFAESDLVDLRWSGYGAGGAGGGVESVTGDGVDNTDPLHPALSFPTPGDIGAANASHDHDAGDIVSGTLDAARLPAPTTTDLGGVKRNTGTAGQYVNGIDSSGNLEYDTPAGGGGSTDGWIAVSEAWSYASASTITIPSDGTTKYRKYMKIRFKQGGGYKYYVSCAVTATLLTIIVNNDYTVANSAITDIAVSFEDAPYGFPTEFAYTPPSWLNLTVGNASVNLGHYKIVGATLIARAALQWGTTTSITGTGIGVALPTGLSASSAYQITNHMVGMGRFVIGGTPYQGTVVISANATIASLTTLAASSYVTNTSITSTVPASWSSSSNIEMQFVVMLN